MAADRVDVFGPLIRKLDRLSRLEETDLAAIRSLPFRVETKAAHTQIIRERDIVKHCSLLLYGFTACSKITRQGRRQIVSFHMAGDILDIQHILLSRADHDIQALTEVVVVHLPVKDLKAAAYSHPAIADALWRASLIEGSVLREWVLNVGRRDSKSRIAHLLCEFVARASAAGLGSPETFEFPMTQDQIADATGLTPIHVNRMLRALAEDGLIRHGRRQMSISNWRRMQEVADFSPDYLNAAA